MSVNERRKYLKLVLSRYVQSGRKERIQLLTEMGEVTGLHRKSLIRLMNMPILERALRKVRLKARWDGVAVVEVVRIVWERLDYVCAEQLIPALLDTACQLAEWEESTLTAEVEEKLSSISRATVQRHRIRPRG